MDAEKELIRLLVDRQQRSRISDAQMAERLGVSRELWNKTRRAEVPVRAKVLHGVVKAFPELIPDTLNFLRSGGSKLPGAGADVTERLSA